MSDDLLRINF